MRLKLSDVEVSWGFLVIVVFGLIARLYLAYSLPIWHDEAFSIWASERSWYAIFSGEVDPVHPPGYYLILKVWSLVSSHLFWMRLSSVLFFVVNTYLLNRLGGKIEGKIFPLALVLAYVLSGYFVIFDWQVRMYTGLLTLILLSLNLLFEKLSSRQLVIFAIINAVGLFFDYGFVWYFFPMVLFVLYKLVSEKKLAHKKLALSVLTSGFLASWWLPSFLRNYESGVGGIAWMQHYLDPTFFVPFFLGTQLSALISLVTFGLILIGLFSVVIRPKRNELTVFVVLGSLISTLVALYYSIFVSPLFHVRSLQILGLMIILLLASSVKFMIKKLGGWAGLVVVLVLVVNFFSTINILYRHSGKLLVSFFPWKKLQEKIKTIDVDYVVFRQTKELQSDKLVWGLKYTLEGKEKLFEQPVEYVELKSEDDGLIFGCELVTNRLSTI